MSEPRDEYNRSGLLAFAFSMVFVCAFFVYIVAINKGVDLGENVVDPNAPAVEGAVPVFDITKVQDPWVSTPEMVAYGKKFYSTNCAMCHGNEGKGDGAAGAALNPKPRNLVEGKWTQGEGVIAHFKVLQNGIKGSSMAAYSHFKPADRWAVIHFIDSITENKSKDDPAKVAEFAKTAQ
ncbi:c-type cytochrome [Bdellovibrio bacteriovorus]|uniref:c-type cytochrome n=1 Tax=Bdellovibrio bacteriovorus TaxID=959 RepID=UPI003AA84FD2